MHKKMMSYILGTLAFFVLSCVLFVVGLRVWHKATIEDQTRSRESLKLVVLDIKLGMTKSQVYAVFEKHRWTYFRETDGELRMWTKPQPLPTSWIVRLVFKGENLSAIKFGSVDNISKHPGDAPPDIE